MHQHSFFDAPWINLDFRLIEPQTTSLDRSNALDIEQSLSQIAVHALNGFLARAFQAAASWLIAHDHPSRSDQIFFNYVTSMAVDASCDQLLSFSAGSNSLSWQTHRLAVERPR